MDWPQIITSFFTVVVPIFAFMGWMIGRIDKKFELIDRRFDQIDRRFEQVDRKLEDLRKDIHSLDIRLTRVEGYLGGPYWEPKVKSKDNNH